MAFKIVDDAYGQLTFMRIYQGTLAKGEGYYNQRTQQKQRFSRIVRMHSDKREEIDTAGAGDIVAVMGADTASGDTYAAENNTARSQHVRSRSCNQNGNQSQKRDGLDLVKLYSDSPKTLPSRSPLMMRLERLLLREWVNYLIFTSSEFVENTR